MDKVIIGKRVRRKRKELALTRDEFAEKIEISPQFLAEIENGKKGMSAETLYKICDRFMVSADYMLLGRESISELRTPLYETLIKIPPEYYEMVENILASFLKAIKVANQNNGFNLCQGL